MVAVENQKINRNEIWKKCVCLAKVMRNGMKLLGGSGQGVEKGTQKFKGRNSIRLKNLNLD